MAVMDNPYGNLLALLQSGALGPGNGPIQPQNPQPGFRAPGTPGMAMPQMQQPQGLGQQAGGLMNQLAMFKKPWSPTSGGATPGVPTGAGDPTGGAGPAYLGGVSPLGAVDPTAMAANGGGGFFGFLKGLF